MDAPMTFEPTRPLFVRSLRKSTWTNLPKRLLLSLRPVLAFPNASSTGFVAMTLFSMLSSGEPELSAERNERWRKQSLAASVLPAPDSPKTQMDCEPTLSSMLRNARSATRNGDGSRPLGADAVSREYPSMSSSVYSLADTSLYGLVLMRAPPASVYTSPLWCRTRTPQSRLPSVRLSSSVRSGGPVSATSGSGLGSRSAMVACRRSP
mmetsp:Transcript_26561/g.83075  ORF Transcript_26561/g.83075 Transcript_26561/m.83075 type:complete len:208 (+) Transcript_26561:365-988(+)